MAITATRLSKKPAPSQFLPFKPAKGNILR